ncbi:MAG TPA: TetR/AcrR family transcriptional regulator [Gaiella sp.]|jgi:AcrR family transcriptional regulator|nr:TetR/AcrR family transcriptional regulator [Gaiella sp.]
MTPPTTGTRARAPRSDGMRTRQAILDEAARLATVEGLDGLSLARLAERVGMSKSGLFAHFGSKEELQLATVERATEIFDEVVVRPAADLEDGLERLRALLEGFLGHVEVAVFPGGCFFASASAELDTRAGPVRERALGVVSEWTESLEGAVRDAQREGLIARDVDAAQLVFELDAYLMLANAQFVASGSKEPLERARRAIAERLEGVVAHGAST